MGITAIKRVENRSSTSAKLLNRNNENTTGHNKSIAPGESLAVDM